MPHSVPSTLAYAQLIAEVRCRRCAYDLRGLSLDGRCPECGLEIWLSVQHTVDPAASKLPKLRDPVGVGKGLLWLVICGLAATVLLILRAGMALIEARFMSGPIALPADMLLPAGLAPLAALWSIYRFMPPRGEDADVAVRADLRLLTLALVGWGAAGVLLWVQARTGVAGAGIAPPEPTELLLHTAMALCAAAALSGLRSVLRTIGQRSREYRRAQGGRQGVKPMIVASLGVAAGSLMRMAGAIWEEAGVLEVTGAALVSVCMFMILIGLSYLLVNAMWISRALRKPPPLLENLIRFVPGSRPPSES